ncbi:hypothetical protein FBU30_010967, partial [Linnemannia zychae]
MYSWPRVLEHNKGEDIYKADENPAATVATPDARTFDEILLSPLFNGVFAPRLLTATFDSQSTQDRLTVQRFWLLVIQNSKTLCKLRLHRSLNVLARIGSVKFLRNTILSLQQLCDFDNHSDKLNVAEFLDHLPHLQNLMTPTFQLQNNMLHYIKSLPIQLQSITLTGQILARGFFTILAQLPSLRFLRVIGLTWDNITDREIHNVMEGIPIVFRVQIVGVTRLSIEQQDRFKRAAEKVANLETLTTQEVGLLQLVGQSRYEQEQILERLASLRCLQVLDLGFEYRRVDLSNELQPRTDLFEGKKYISYGMPIFDTLELSLDAGLSHLARLQRLEVFGFEGLNHRIGEEELQWIAEAWPRLRVLRGLHPITLKYLRPDRRRDELREYMQELRQDVEQKGAEEQ